MTIIYIDIFFKAVIDFADRVNNKFGTKSVVSDTSLQHLKGSHCLTTLHLLPAWRYFQNVEWPISLHTEITCGALVLSIVTMCNVLCNMESLSFTLSICCSAFTNFRKENA